MLVGLNIIRLTRVLRTINHLVDFLKMEKEDINFSALEKEELVSYILQLRKIIDGYCMIINMQKQIEKNREATKRLNKISFEMQKANRKRQRLQIEGEMDAGDHSSSVIQDGTYSTSPSTANGSI